MSFLSQLCSQQLQCLQTFEYPSVLIRCRANACNGSECAWVSYHCSLWGESGYGPVNDPLQELYRPFLIRLTFLCLSLEVKTFQVESLFHWADMLVLELTQRKRLSTWKVFNWKHLLFRISLFSKLVTVYGNSVKKITMRKNLPKTLDQLIFCKCTLVFSKCSEIY